MILTTMTMSNMTRTSHNKDKEIIRGVVDFNMMTRMTTRTRQGQGPGKCDGSVEEDKLQKQHEQHLWVQLVIRTCTAQWLNVDELRLKQS